MSHGVENYFPRLWGTGICDANFCHFPSPDTPYFRLSLIDVCCMSAAGAIPYEKNIHFYVHPTGGWTYYFCFFRRPASGVWRPTWFPDILGNSSYPIFTKFGMQVYWVNSLYGIALVMIAL